MSNVKKVLTLVACSCICLTVATSASADFLAAKTVIKGDPDTVFLCNEANGDFVPFSLTVCNVFANFSDPNDQLLNIGNSDLQVFDGANPDVFYHHPFGGDTPYGCFLQQVVFPDLICDSYTTIGNKCDGPGEPAGADTTAPDGSWEDVDGDGVPDVP
ncbi:MAG: hypothetical protein IH899_16970, partial [Planctomycetes bacterium]|nr:hypothetical protein [Planctomycetota bacterium]